MKVAETAETCGSIMYVKSYFISVHLLVHSVSVNIHLTLEGPCIIFAIYIQSKEIHNVVALIKFLLVLRCQLYMFRTPSSGASLYILYVQTMVRAGMSSWYNVLGRNT